MERAARNLWILAGIAVALLIYQAWTLAASVLLPLLSNPNILQTDFHYYYEAAVRFRGDQAQLYMLSDDVIAGFAYPPPAIVPFMVLSFLPLGAAMALLTASSYALLIASLMLWVRYLREHSVAIDSASALAATIIAVALGPVYSNAIFGQVNAWVLACVVLFVTLGRRHSRFAGAALASGVLLKIYPILMVAAGLWDRSAWRRIGYAAVAGAVIIVIALPVVPFGSYQTFLNDVLPARFDKTAVHISNQSLIAFIERFALPANRFLNWTGEQAITATSATRAFNWIFGLAVIALLWHRAVRRSRMEAVQSVAALTALAAVIAPLGWGHTYVLALPLVMLHLVSVRRGGSVYAAVVFACVLVMLVPAGRRLGFIDVLPAALQNIAYSRYLLATLVLIALPLPLTGAHTNLRRTA